MRWKLSEHNFENITPRVVVKKTQKFLAKFRLATSGRLTMQWLQIAGNLLPNDPSTGYLVSIFTVGINSKLFRCTVRVVQEIYLPKLYVAPVGCGGRIVSSAGKSNVMTSPLYPKPYPADRTCHFVFEGRSDERIQLRFSDFQLFYSYGDPDEPHEYAMLVSHVHNHIGFVIFNCSLIR